MAVSSNKQKVVVRYDAWQGIVEERIIRDNEWAAIGIDFKTVSFNRSNNFRLDATDWPEDVMEYFEHRDQAFKVTRGEAVEAQEKPEEKLAQNPPAEDEAVVLDEESDDKAEEKPEEKPAPKGKTR